MAPSVRYSAAIAGQLGFRTSLLLTAAGLSLSPLIIAVSPLSRLGKGLPAAHEPTARYHADGEAGND
jgi:hypothetical protein